MRNVIYSFVVREIKLLFYDKFALFWVVFWPIFWIVMTAYLFVPPGQGQQLELVVGVVNYESTPWMSNGSSMIIEIMRAIEIDSRRLFDVRIYENEGKLIEDLKKGKIDAGLIIPENFTLDLFTGTARLEVLIGGRDLYTAMVTRMTLEGFIGELSRRIGLEKVNVMLRYVEAFLSDQDSSILDLVKRYVYGTVVPINATYRDVKPEGLLTRERILGWFVMGAVGMTFLTTGLSEGAAILYREKTIGSLKRILVSPVSPQALIIAYAISVIVLLLLTAIPVIIAGVFLVGAHISFNPLSPVHWLAFPLFAIGAFLSFGFGMLLSLFAKTHRSAGGLGVILGLLISFTTGVWFPRAMMPEPIRVLADYSPFTWVMDTIRGILVYDQSLAEIAPLLTRAIIATIVIIIVDIFVYRYKLKKIIESF